MLLNNYIYIYIYISCSRINTKEDIDVWNIKSECENYLQDWKNALARHYFYFINSIFIVQIKHWLYAQII